MKKRQVGQHKGKSPSFSGFLTMPRPAGGKGAHQVTPLLPHSPALPSSSNLLPPVLSQVGFFPQLSQSGALGPPTSFTPPWAPTKVAGQGAGQEEDQG